MASRYTSFFLSCFEAHVEVLYDIGAKQSFFSNILDILALALIRPAVFFFSGLSIRISLEIVERQKKPGLAWFTRGNIVVCLYLLIIWIRVNERYQNLPK